MEQYFYKPKMYIIQFEMYNVQCTLYIVYPTHNIYHVYMQSQVTKPWPCL